ncbi:EF-P 5-aminopentanol modification-associated protein YfmF [Ornithinibacillus contaminans]|uniref:EF-P 5-aminopentanol modification-associated protein YfmF n=1 Tax=Ornithinibacillus contaminans TaxID=694055 RepID=UPI00064DA645|nr:pitrilysin family protein [Ornithinibacillus contaminans]
MVTIEEQVKNMNGYNLHVIPNKKFKTVHIVVKFKAPLNRETITKRALLPYVLQQGSKKYPSRKELQIALDDLYGSVLSMDSGKKGDNHIISFRLEVANDKFIPNETNLVEDSFRLLNEVIFQPNVQGDAFVESVFNREVGTLRQKIKSIIDDKMQYANMRLLDEMLDGDPYQLHVHGYEEDLDSLNATDLYRYYTTMLKEDQVDIYILGDLDQEKMEAIVTANMERTSSGATTGTNDEESPSRNHHAPKEVIDKQNVQQAKLHIGYRTNCTYRDKEYPALQVFNGILGGFPSSKLFINVREKNSLAYYASSRLESHKGLLLVFSGIAPGDYEKARAIIEEQMKAMKNGDISENELAESKELIVNQLLETLDHPQGIIEMLYQQVIANADISPHQLIDKIKAVQLDDVKAIGEKITEDTVYLLTSEGGTSNE